MKSSRGMTVMTGRRTNGSRSWMQHTMETMTMNITKSVGRDGQIGIGVILLALLAVSAALQLATWVSGSHPLAVTAVTTNYSPVPQGYSDYANLHTVAPRARFSALPSGATDHQPRAVAAPESKLSAVPRGLSDYQALRPMAHVNHSAVPAGLTDYLDLQPMAQARHSPVPQGLIDYQGLQTNRAAQPHFSAVPRGWSDYQGLQTAQAQPRHSTLPRGWTDYLSPAR